MTNPAKPSLEEFFGNAPAPLDGSSPWASRYASDLKRMIQEYSARRPRSVQKHLGPSELGEECSRQVVAKMANAPTTNHVTDPWASFVGTAIHAEMENVLRWHNQHTGELRWIPEQRVYPLDDHPGTADAYDAKEKCLTDWKALSKARRDKVKNQGPPRKYLVQILLYAHGYRRLGLPVERVALVILPRTSSTMDDIYVWDRLYTEEDDRILADVFEQTEARKQLAQMVIDGKLGVMDIPASPSDESCYFCPIFRPEAKKDGTWGCPGHRAALY